MLKSRPTSSLLDLKPFTDVKECAKEGLRLFDQLSKQHPNVEIGVAILQNSEGFRGVVLPTGDFSPITLAMKAMACGLKLHALYDGRAAIQKAINE